MPGTVADYEAWAAKQHKDSNSSRLTEWLRNDPAPRVQPVSLAERASHGLPFLLAAIAVYFLCRWALRNAKPAIVYALVQGVIGWNAVSQFWGDIGRQVRTDAAARASRPRARSISNRAEPGRFALAGRFLFNVAIAPLLLGFVLAGLVWVAGLIID